MQSPLKTLDSLDQMNADQMPDYTIVKEYIRQRRVAVKVIFGVGVLGVLNVIGLILISKLPIVAPMLKQLQICCNSDLNSICDNISVIFPQQASKEDKALILAATIMIEFMYLSFAVWQTNIFLFVYSSDLIHFQLAYQDYL